MAPGIPPITRLVARIVRPGLEAAGFSAVGRPRNFARASTRDYLRGAHEPYVHCVAAIRTAEAIDLQLGVDVAHSLRERTWALKQGMDPENPTVGFCTFQFTLSRLARGGSDGGWQLQNEPERALSEMMSAFASFGLSYFHRFREYPEPLLQARPSELPVRSDGASGILRTLSGYYSSNERLALLLAGVCARTGHTRQALGFIERGLELHRAEMQRQAVLFGDPSRLTVESDESRALEALRSSLPPR